MERPKTIVDASVAVKWFSEEENSPQARTLLKEHIGRERFLRVPDLFSYELLNALRFKKQSHEILHQALRDLIGLQLEIVRHSPEFLALTLEFSLTYDLTIYDASYLALAEIEKCELFTCDKKLLSLKHPLVRGLV